MSKHIVENETAFEEVEEVGKEVLQHDAADFKASVFVGKYFHEKEIEAVEGLEKRADSSQNMKSSDFNAIEVAARAWH